MLFYVVYLWETILCVHGMYDVVLQHEISAPKGVQHTWHYSGTYSVRTGMYWSVLLYIFCTSTYLVRTAYVQVRTKYPVPVRRFTIPDVTYNITHELHGITWSIT